MNNFAMLLRSELNIIILSLEMCITHITNSLAKDGSAESLWNEGYNRNRKWRRSRSSQGVITTETIPVVLLHLNALRVFLPDLW